MLCFAKRQRVSEAVFKGIVIYHNTTVFGRTVYPTQWQLDDLCKTDNRSSMNKFLPEFCTIMRNGSAFLFYSNKKTK